MAKIKCPRCGYTEDDGRPHDRATYYETCVVCEPPARKQTGAVFGCTAADLNVGLDDPSTRDRARHA